jgi:hypothetical protein
MTKSSLAVHRATGTQNRCWPAISTLQYMNVNPTWCGMAAGSSPVLEYSANFFIS